MKLWSEYQVTHQERFLEELLNLLRIPSISADSSHKEDMNKVFMEIGALKEQIKTLNAQVQNQKTIVDNLAAEHAKLQKIGRAHV